MTTNQLCKKHNVKIELLPGAAEKPVPGMPNNWRVKLTAWGRTLSVDYHGGSAITTVSAAEVLSSLCSDVSSGEMAFEEFCSEFGGDTDSRKTRALWKACRRMAPKVRAFLGEFFDEFAASEH